MEPLINKIQPIIENKVNEFSRTAMIDKLSLSGVAIQEITDTDDLDKKGILCNGKSRMKYYTKSGKEFTSLSIKDDFFGKLKAGVNYGTGSLYSNFATSVKNEFCSNLVCNTMGDYKRQIADTKDYLIGKYGIYADLENAIVNSIEINRTFQIDSSITDYKRPIKLIAWNIPRKKRMNLVQDFKIKQKTVLKQKPFLSQARKFKKTNMKKRKNQSSMKSWYFMIERNSWKKSFFYQKYTCVLR